MAPAVLLPVALFVVHGSFFTGWIVDDAGISLAYSKNLASGYGLVAQPGDSPVEAFSNPLWVLLFSPFYALGSVDPYLMPKLVSGVLVALSFFLCHHALTRYVQGGTVVAVLGLSLASLQTAFVVWCVSGLENPLYIFLLVALFAHHAALSRPRVGDAILSGGLTGLVALTRPEGILFAGIFPVWAVVTRDRKEIAQLVPPFLISTALVGGAYVAFRILYFGDVLPNPYYAKGGPGLRTVTDIIVLKPYVRSELAGILTAALGPLGLWGAGVILIAGVWNAIQRALEPVHLLLVSMTAISLGGYLLLPPDWMAEHRFATPFFLFLYLTLAASVVSVSVQRGTGGRVVMGTAAVLVGFSVYTGSITRTPAFARHPTISLTEVADRANKFRDLAVLLGVRRPSLLTADVGATLLMGEVRTIDLGMLCDRDIARWLGETAGTPNYAAFHPYIFEEIQPTFISTRAYHTWRARLDLDPRFTEDYAALATYADDWILDRLGQEMESGDYVRKEVVRSAGLRVEDIRANWTLH